MEFIQKHIQFHCMLARHLELQGFFDFEVWPYCRDVGRSKNLGGGGQVVMVVGIVVNFSTYILINTHVPLS